MLAVERESCDVAFGRWGAERADLTNGIVEFELDDVAQLPDA